MSGRRDIAAAKSFFKKAIESRGIPEKITLDGYAASHAAVQELKRSRSLPINVLIRTSRYLSNLIEQDHRRVKQRIYPMLGLKRFENAVITNRGGELIHKIRERQFDTSELRLKELGA